MMQQRIELYARGSYWPEIFSKNEKFAVKFDPVTVILLSALSIIKQ